MRLPPIVAALAVLTLAPSVAACGSGSDAAGDGACGPVQREALDPEFLLHVLGDADVEYLSDPPTSGPHQPAPEVSGAVDEPISRPIQVGLLEGGAILIQHDPDLPADDLARLAGLADPGVVVAPNDDLDDPIVATAWVYKRTCSGVDLAALQEFVEARLGEGPDAPGLSVATDAWGIDDGWWSSDGTWTDLGPSTRSALRAAMGADAHLDAPPAGPGIVVARPGSPTGLLGPARLVLEDGTDLGIVDQVPADVPIGLHALLGPDGEAFATVLAGPGRCHLPDRWRTWGLVAQVPTSRSHASWGIGDLADVRALAGWVHDLGGGALGLSPLHAPTPVAPLPASPYSPSSRRWRSPLLLRVDEVPGAAGDPVVAEAAAAARAVLRDPIVDRDRCWALQLGALEHLWRARRTADDGPLAAWRDGQGPALEGWARFCALAEVHGADWSAWPADVRHPHRPSVDRAVAPLAERVAFHAWLQLLVHDQLDAALAAAPDVRVVQDLAIGCDPGGADAWLLQDLLALDVSVGAPPDDFERAGQSWGLPPFIPWRLRAAGYRPLAELLRSAMAGGGGLRVDHVMGLTRLFWVPPGHDPSAGGYVRFAGWELLEVLALESARAGAIVVGEDLGTVEPELREQLRDRRVLSTRVVWFEDEPPSAYPEQCEAVATTHDLPTVAGVWSGADADELAELGRPAPPDAAAEVQRRVEALVGSDRTTPVPDVVARLHAHLSEGPAALVLGTLEDLCGVEHRPNVPGTTDRPGNWSTALPVAIDDLPSYEPAARAVEALAAPRRPPITG